MATLHSPKYSPSLLGREGIRGLRRSSREETIADLCTKLGISSGDSEDDAEPAEEGNESTRFGDASLKISKKQSQRISEALDRVRHRSDPVFDRDSYDTEFKYRLAAFRAGKLVAFRAEGMDMQPMRASASLQRPD